MGDIKISEKVELYIWKRTWELYHELCSRDKMCSESHYLSVQKSGLLEKLIRELKEKFPELRDKSDKEVICIIEYVWLTPYSRFPRSLTYLAKISREIFGDERLISFEYRTLATLCVNVDTLAIIKF